jgi:hypothetical protein
MANKLTTFIHRKVLGGRAPDVTIGGPERPYLLRWWVIPRNRWFNIYFHQFLRSDDERALHDHPWASCSILLSGRYVEVTPGRATIRQAGAWSGFTFRRAEAAHRIALFAGDPHVFTLFMTGPWQRPWGFHCPNGWRHWRNFIDPKDPGRPGPGCD